ncbi:alkaline phosphatase family protein [Oceaniglobus roseus]|uniref:alkaline phosphatase family protein n=1 Tax=Oceaniglobus roseus TaxID=1737570 RepID=UPI000C7F6A34|nr:alkaline phosphatase family protein [Kandeliimicrobium roseum]
MARNVLFIMADQLRWDYLSCYGHPHLQTPNIDALAARGVRFTNAYVQSPFCGPSRMSTYTGRYCRSHGSTWNGIPLRVGERTIGDHLRQIGVRPVIVGKTHMRPDVEGMEWLGIDPASEIGVTLAECGFEPFERDDGLHPRGYDDAPEYNRWLNERGIGGENPWNDRANSARGDDGERLTGWLLKHSNRAADIPEELSETPYMTTRAMEFMEAAGEGPWLCHLSYIKPHWPYIVPAPYHDMYGAAHVVPPVRAEAERETDHPVFRAYQQSRICRTFARDEVRERVIPAYMGLIRQIDDQLGRLFAFMEARGLMEETMIVFTSDHGDYLGDHWMGEKDLFHDCSVKVPLIVADPRAGAARGAVSDALVEAIDLAPTFLSFFGGAPKPHILEGRDLSPLLRGEAPGDWRAYAVSEYDYATREARKVLGTAGDASQLFMVRDARWKYVHAEGFRPMLFDLERDPDELEDLGASGDAEHAAVRARMAGALFAWARRHHSRVTVTPERLDSMLASDDTEGIVIGVWDEAEFARLNGRPVGPRD